MRIDALLEPAGARLGAVAVDDGSRVLRRDELIRAVAESAERLKEAGLTERTRAAVEVGTDAGSVVRWLACLSAAGSVLALDPGLTRHERSRLITQYGAMVTVTAAGIEHEPDSPAFPRGTPGAAGDGDALAGRAALATSGTSGKPKVVARELAAVVDNALEWAAAVGMTPEVRVVTTTPLHHSYGLAAGMAAALAVGATLRTLPSPVNLAAIPAAVSPPGPTVLLSIPFVYRRLLRRPPPRPVDGLTAVSAGESIEDQTAATFAEGWGRPVRDHLGATELGQLALADGPGCGVGRPIGGVTVRAQSAPGEDEAELWWKVRGASPLYVESGQLSSCLNDGWFASGDLGSIDAAGCARITRRRSERLNIAGRKIDPVEVEAVVREFPGITGAAVTAVGVHELRLCVLIEAPSAPDIALLRRYLAGRLSSYKIPQRYLHVDQLPKTASGKLLRHALADFFPADERGYP